MCALVISLLVYVCYQSQSVTGEGLLSLQMIIRQEDKQFVEQVEHCRLKS